MTTVFELFASFKAANAINQWNLSLVQAVQNCVLVGHIDPHVIMLGGSESCLEVIKFAWMKQVLKPPLGFSIQYLGELCNFLVSKTPQCSSAELEEALCKCICELVNTGMPSNLKYIMRHLTKFLPLSPDQMLFSESADNFLSLDMVKNILESLQQKGLVYNTGHGYNVMTPDKLRVARWLGELPDVSRLLSSTVTPPSSNSNNPQHKPHSPTLMLTSTTDCDPQQKQPPPHLRQQQQQQSDNNTDDCLSCYDLHGNRYIATANNNASNSNNVFSDPNNNGLLVNSRRLDPVESSVNLKTRMFCANGPKKDLSKHRSSYVKYESAGLMAKIICGMKRLRVHLPAHQSHQQVPQVAQQHQQQPIDAEMVAPPVPRHRRVEPDEGACLHSRLSQSMYAFSQEHQPQQQQQQQLQCPGEEQPLCCVYHHHAYYPVMYHHYQQQQPPRAFSPKSALLGQLDQQQHHPGSLLLLDEEARGCCSDLMLHRSSTTTVTAAAAGDYPYHLAPATGATIRPGSANSNLAPAVPSTAPVATAGTGTTGGGNNGTSSRFFSPFTTTCDSGFNSVHNGATLHENEVETSHSKTSSPPDCSKKLLAGMPTAGAAIFTGPCAWQQMPGFTDSFYQQQQPVTARTPGPTPTQWLGGAAALAPVLESAANHQLRCRPLSANSRKPGTVTPNGLQ